MYRYTTPTLPITISDVDFSEVRNFRIALKGKGQKLVLVVSADDAIVDAEHKTINLALTQEETAMFEAGHVMLQVRIIYISGSVQATPQVSVTMKDVIDEVIV